MQNTNGTAKGKIQTARLRRIQMARCRIQTARQKAKFTKFKYDGKRQKANDTAKGKIHKIQIERRGKIQTERQNTKYEWHGERRNANGTAKGKLQMARHRIQTARQKAKFTKLKYDSKRQNTNSTARQNTNSTAKGQNTNGTAKGEIQTARRQNINGTAKGKIQIERQKAN